MWFKHPPRNPMCHMLDLPTPVVKTVVRPRSPVDRLPAPRASRVSSPSVFLSFLSRHSKGSTPFQTGPGLPHLPSRSTVNTTQSTPSQRGRQRTPGRTGEDWCRTGTSYVISPGVVPDPIEPTGYPRTESSRRSPSRHPIG